MTQDIDKLVAKCARARTDFYAHERLECLAECENALTTLAKRLEEAREVIRKADLWTDEENDIGEWREDARRWVLDKPRRDPERFSDYETLRSELERVKGEFDRVRSVAGESRVVLVDQLLVAEARIAGLVALLRRYRTETPLRHQPHMIAAEVDAALANRPSKLPDGCCGYTDPDGMCCSPPSAALQPITGETGT